VDGGFRVGHTGQDAGAGLDGYLAGRLRLSWQHEGAACTSASVVVPADLRDGAVACTVRRLQGIATSRV
jgi:hypothetical protein